MKPGDLGPPCQAFCLRKPAGSSRDPQALLVRVTAQVAGVEGATLRATRARCWLQASQGTVDSPERENKRLLPGGRLGGQCGTASVRPSYSAFLLEASLTTRPVRGACVCRRALCQCPRLPHADSGVATPPVRPPGPPPGLETLPARAAFLVQVRTGRLTERYLPREA